MIMKKWLFFILFLVLLPSHVKANDFLSLTFTKNDYLYFQLLELEERVNEPVIEPVVDRVWKKIPGYNGRKLNVKKSYKELVELSILDETRLVFDEIEPTTKLGDLPIAAIYKANPKKDSVSFIMNVAWGNEYIPTILSVLKENHLHITFSLEGKWAKNNPDLVKLIVEGGHELANHSYSHPNMANLSYQEQLEQIQKTNEIIRAYTNKDTVWFGPPSGSYNELTLKAAHDLGMETVMWSVDTIDWKDKSQQEILNRVVTRLHPGAIILMHPKENTMKVLPELIKQIKEQKYKITTLTEILSSKR